MWAKKQVVTPYQQKAGWGGAPIIILGQIKHEIIYKSTFSTGTEVNIVYKNYEKQEGQIIYDYYYIQILGF